MKRTQRTEEKWFCHLSISISEFPSSQEREIINFAVIIRLKKKNTSLRKTFSWNCKRNLTCRNLYIRNLCQELWVT